MRGSTCARRLAGLVLAPAWLLGTGAPAVADAAPQGVARCPAGALCVWDHPDFAGHLTIYQNGFWDGRCQPVKGPVGSVADQTTDAPWRLELFVFRSKSHSAPCASRGLYAHYAPGQTDPGVPGGPATGIQIYADPNPGPGH